MCQDHATTTFLTSPGGQVGNGLLLHHSRTLPPLGAIFIRVHLLAPFNASGHRVSCCGCFLRVIICGGGTCSKGIPRDKNRIYTESTSVSPNIGLRKIAHRVEKSKQPFCYHFRSYDDNHVPHSNLDYALSKYARV